MDASSPVLPWTIASFLLLSSSAVAAQHSAERANAYDDEWQDGTDGWVSNARAILQGADGLSTPGFTLFIGDSLTGGSSALAEWARFGAGKTESDEEILRWMNVSTDPITVDSRDGFGLATPYHCRQRSYTVGDGMGAWHFLPDRCGGSWCMPDATSVEHARELLDDCDRYDNNINLQVMLTQFADAQFAIYESNLHADHPDDPYIYREVLEFLIERHIVPIVITYTYRQDSDFNRLVDRYNAALRSLARDMRLPLIDFQQELLERRPFEEWPGTFLSDGVHYTGGGGGFGARANPYEPGGDASTHTTGDALLYNGYGLRAWLAIQKMKEVRALVVDDEPAPVSPDAGAPGADAGVTDGGTPLEGDAGRRADGSLGPETESSGCTTSPSRATLGWALLWIFALRARRRNTVRPGRQPPRRSH